VDEPKSVFSEKERVEIQFKSDVVYLIQQINDSILALHETIATQNQLLEELFLALPQSKRFVLRK
jgi:hypothetical protein